MGREIRRRFKREGIYVYLWLIHVEIWQQNSVKQLSFNFKINEFNLGKKKKKQFSAWNTCNHPENATQDLPFGGPSLTCSRRRWRLQHQKRTLLSPWTQHWLCWPAPVSTIALPEDQKAGQRQNPKKGHLAWVCDSGGQNLVWLSNQVLTAWKQ